MILGAIGLFTLGFAGLLGWGWWRAHRLRAALPTEWTHVGPVPPNADLALSIIRRELPSLVGADCATALRWGGLVTWVAAPYPAFEAGKMLAAGTLDDATWPKLRCVTADAPWKTALAHEVGHYARVACGLSVGDGEAPFYAWVSATNAAIRVGLSLAATAALAERGEV